MDLQLFAHRVSVLGRQKVSEEGIASGYSDGTYRPAQNVNRAQMAALIARMFLGMPYKGL